MFVLFFEAEGRLQRRKWSFFVRYRWQVIKIETEKYLLNLALVGQLVTFVRRVSVE